MFDSLLHFLSSTGVYLLIGLAVLALIIWAFRFTGRRELNSTDPRQALVLAAGDKSLKKLYLAAESEEERDEIASFAQAILDKKAAESAQEAAAELAEAAPDAPPELAEDAAFAAQLAELSTAVAEQAPASLADAAVAADDAVVGDDSFAEHDSFAADAAPAFAEAEAALADAGFDLAPTAEEQAAAAEAAQLAAVLEAQLEYAAAEPLPEQQSAAKWQDADIFADRSAQFAREANARVASMLADYDIDLAEQLPPAEKEPAPAAATPLSMAEFAALLTPLQPAQVEVAAADLPTAETMPPVDSALPTLEAEAVEPVDAAAEAEAAEPAAEIDPLLAEVSSLLGALPELEQDAADLPTVAEAVIADTPPAPPVADTAAEADSQGAVLDTVNTVRQPSYDMFADRSADVAAASMARLAAAEEPAPAQPQPAAPAAGVISCPYCQAPLEDAENRFCIICGMPLPTLEAEAAPAAQTIAAEAAPLEPAQPMQAAAESTPPEQPGFDMFADRSAAVAAASMARLAAAEALAPEAAPQEAAPQEAAPQEAAAAAPQTEPAEQAEQALQQASQELHSEAARTEAELALLQKSVDFWSLDMSKTAAQKQAAADGTAQAAPPSPSQQARDEAERLLRERTKQKIDAMSTDEIIASVRELERRILEETKLDLHVSAELENQPE